MIDVLLFWMPALPWFLPGTYLFALVLAGIFPSRVPPVSKVKDRPDLRCALVIPAHNEELSLATTLESVLSAEGAPALEDVFVIADNCSDRTAWIAREKGVRVWERRDLENRGKGQALDAWINLVSKELEAYDLVAMVDADTLVDEAFFTEVKTAFEANPRMGVAQGYYGVSNPEANWRTGLSEIALAVAHDYRQRARQRLGGNAGLKGNGMVFRTEILLQHGWPAHSIVEDLEFGLQLTLEGIQIRYLAQAVVRAEMVTSGAAAESQKRRWEGGRFEVVRTWVPRLLKAGFGRGFISRAEAVLELLFPPLGLWGILCLGGIALGWFVPSAAIAATAGMVCALGLVSGALLHRPEARRSIPALRAVPRYLGSKVLFYLNEILRREATGWHRTRREAEMNELS